MNLELREAFDAFYCLAKEKLCPPENSSIERPLKIARNRGLLLDLVKDLEQSQKFEALTQKTQKTFKEKGKIIPENRVKVGIKNYWRRSRGYIDLFEGNPTNQLWEKFLDELGKRNTFHTYFAVLEGVDFKVDHKLIFDDFEILQFSQTELDTIFQKDILNTFYPWVLPGENDLKFFHHYWWIKTSPIDKEIFLNRKIKIPRFVDQRYRGVRDDLKPILKKIILYHWKSGFNDDYIFQEDYWAPWSRFCIPYEMGISDSLLDSPPPLRFNSELLLHPLVDSATGEVLEDEVPYPPHTIIEKDEVGKFQNEIIEISKLLYNPILFNSNWKSVSLALDILLKAFFEEDPLEEFVWHFIVTEALLQERREITDKLIERLSKIAGTPGVPGKGKKAIKKLYDHRSKMLHGEILFDNEDQKNKKRKDFQKKYPNPLWDARELARKTCWWFLDHLYCRKNEMGEEAKHLTRVDILRQIDQLDS